MVKDYHTFYTCQVAGLDGIEPPAFLSESTVLPLYERPAEVVGLEPTKDRASKAPAIAAMRHFYYKLTGPIRRSQTVFQLTYECIKLTGASDRI